MAKRPRLKPKSQETERCRVDGAKLRALRQDAELSIRQLALAVEVDPKTITDLEAGRRDWSYVRVVRSIAAHPDIDVAWRDLLAVSQKQRKPAARTRAASSSSLEAYVAEERRIGGLSPLLTPLGEVPNFGAIQLVNVFSSPASHAGETYYVRGLVDAQRGLAAGDGAALGVDPQASSRFLISRKIGSIEQPLTMTIVSTTTGETRSLQRAWEADDEIAALVRVVVANVENGALTLLGKDAIASRAASRPVAPDWIGFSGLGATTRPHPWVLVVVAMAATR